ncbi:winged helix-turn-helix domain-containing protein [Gibbsiella quercinecans]|uniref:winged helix-turn-helix domain-containing protein n=1 Tax=Gibbsiella quercinecans TaxID=929813 RepID=UPI001600179A
MQPLRLCTGNIHVTAASIVAFVRERLDVCYSILGMNKWLHRIGYKLSEVTKGVIPCGDTRN